MKITASRNLGREVNGECAMLDKYGNVYPCIDNLMHPNPGTAEDEYSEIERTIDWLVGTKIYPAYPLVETWLRARVSQLADYDDISDVIYDTLYCDAYDPCNRVLDMISDLYEDYASDPELAKHDQQINETEAAAKIATYLNEHFLRVRVNGKLNPNNEDAIYFRISSHGYDWGRVIEDFMWDTYQDTSKMPNRLWIGHDAETNPPETVLFDGTFEEFLQEDNKVFADTFVCI